MNFPVYRCYSDKRSFFKIISAKSFEEFKVLGGFYQHYQIEAVQLPDRNFVADLIELRFEGVEEISADEFEKTIIDITKTKVLLA